MKKQHLLPLLALPAILGLAACKDESKPADGKDGAAAPSSSGFTGPGGVLYETALPPELIEGTPVAITGLPNLEPAATSAPEFKVPEGTVLLSGGKTVTSSDDFPLIGNLALVTDGEKEAGEGYYVELENGSQWVQIDLEKEADIHAIHVWHYHSQRRAYKGVVVQISNDPEFKEGVTTVFNNDFADSNKLGKGADRPYVETRFGKVISGGGTKGRYVRLYSNGNSSDDTNHYIEVEVHGIPAA
jgi:hypothetical protein